MPIPIQQYTDKARILAILGWEAKWIYRTVKLHQGSSDVQMSGDLIS